MSIEVMKRIKSLLQDTKMIDSHTISAVVAECDAVILAPQPATTEPVKVAPYNPTEEMRWAMKRIDPALSSEQCRALWSAAWSATPSTHPAPSAAVTPEPVVDVRCEGCGYMTHHREHMGCVRAAKQHTHTAPSVPDDSKRLNYLQDRGATIDLIAGVADFYPMRFRVGGLHSSANIDVRAAIDAAMLAAKEPS